MTELAESQLLSLIASSCSRSFVPARPSYSLRAFSKSSWREDVVAVIWDIGVKIIQNSLGHGTVTVGGWKGYSGSIRRSGLSPAVSATSDRRSMQAVLQY